MRYRSNKLCDLWENLLSKATLVAADDERGSFLSRRDSFTRKIGLMSETAEAPWDIQVQGRAAGLWRRIRTQRDTLAGKSFTKPLLAGTARQALGRHMDVLAMGVRQEGGATKWAWAELTEGEMAAARKGRLRTLAQEASVEGPRRSDEAHMKSATASGKAGQWAGVVPAFGMRTRVRFRRYRLGLLDGAAQMVAIRTHRLESVRKDLPSDVPDCPHCGVLESGNHVVLHCPRTQRVWDEAIKVAGGRMPRGPPVAGKWGGMTRQPQVDHLLSSNELADRVTEVRLRARPGPPRPWSQALPWLMPHSKLRGTQHGPGQPNWPRPKALRREGRRRRPKRPPLHRARPHQAWDGLSPLTPAAHLPAGGGAGTSEDTARRPKTNPTKLIRP